MDTNSPIHNFSICFYCTTPTQCTTGQAACISASSHFQALFAIKFNFLAPDIAVRSFVAQIEVIAEAADKI
jgi:hypothetical protein